MSVFEGIPDNPTPPTKHDRDSFLADALLKRATAGEHSKFEYIRSLDELAATRKFKHAIKMLVKQFSNITEDLFKKYFKSIEEDNTSLQQLYAAKKTAKVVEFYKDEIAIADDMIDEYYAYLRSGHIIDSFLGIRRADQDLRDFRKINIE